MEIVLEDNGIGVDAAYAEKVFEPFERLHSRADYEGTGMGLAICKRIVERHHGSIRLQRRDPGPGSRFVVCLPVRQINEE